MYAVERLSAEQVRAAQPDLIALLQDAVNGGASVNFVAPLGVETAAAFWAKVESEVTAQQRIVLAVHESGRVIGSVQLALAAQPNGQHRAEVQKLLVHSQCRRHGIGKTLLAAVETAARDAGRRLLVLDTERGSVAEKLYENFGYTRVGIIPAFALNSDGSALIDTVLFYRQL